MRGDRPSERSESDGTAPELDATDLRILDLLQEN
jgi:hypothetical protein